MWEILPEKGIGEKGERILEQLKLSLYPTMINLYKCDLLEMKVLYVFDCHLIKY